MSLYAVTPSAGSIAAASMAGLARTASTQSCEAPRRRKGSPEGQRCSRQVAAPESRPAPSAPATRPLVDGHRRPVDLPAPPRSLRDATIASCGERRGCWRRLLPASSLSGSPTRQPVRVSRARVRPGGRYARSPRSRPAPRTAHFLRTPAGQRSPSPPPMRQPPSVYPPICILPPCPFPATSAQSDNDEYVPGRGSAIVLPSGRETATIGA